MEVDKEKQIYSFECILWPRILHMFENSKILPILKFDKKKSRREMNCAIQTIFLCFIFYPPLNHCTVKHGFQNWFSIQVTPKMSLGQARDAQFWLVKVYINVKIWSKTSFWSDFFHVLSSFMIDTTYQYFVWLKRKVY